MAIIQRVVKPTTRRGKRILLSREPQVIEGPKKTLFVYGRKTSEVTRTILNDLHRLKNPESVKLSRKNDLTIFEDSTPLEQLMRKAECSIFMVASHSKKRPNNLILGRTFNYSLLDMVELGVEHLKAFKEFPESISVGIKPCLLFSGPSWDQTEEMQTLKSLFVDLFHREKAEAVRLQGLEHVISFTAIDDGKILLRSYRVLLKKSGRRTPRVELAEIGPQIDVFIRRSKLASEDLMKQACKKPKALRIRKTKNISRDAFGTKHGRIHVGRQDINKLQTRKMKGLKNTPVKRKANDDAVQGRSKKTKNEN